MNLHRRFAHSVIFVLTAIVLLPADIAAEQNLIRTGATISLEGQYMSLSYMVRNGYQLWADQLNSMGGLLGRKVEFLFYDDIRRKDLAGPLYEKLITEDKIDLILSPHDSTLTLAAAEVAEKHGCVLLAASAQLEPHRIKR